MLIAFDFDGTLSDSEMTVLLGEQKGIADRMARITERAMNDEIDYAESLRQRVSLLEGLPAERADAAFERVALRENAADLVAALGARHHVANRLPVENRALTGEVEGELVEGTKDRALERLAVQQGVPLADTVAVGDGANDLPMLQVAGLAVGYDPEPTVAPHCDVVVHSMHELRGLFEERGLL